MKTYNPQMKSKLINSKSGCMIYTHSIHDFYDGSWMVPANVIGASDFANKNQIRFEVGIDGKLNDYEEIERNESGIHFKGKGFAWSFWLNMDICIKLEKYGKAKII